MAEMKKKFPVGDMNLQLVLRVGTDPVANTIKTGNGDFESVNFRAVAAPYVGKDKDPEDYWFSIRVSGPGAAFAKTLMKGDLIVLKNGTFSIRKYQKDNQNQIDLQYDVRNPGCLLLVHRKDENRTRTSAPSGTAEPVAATTSVDDDEIPF